MWKKTRLSDASSTGSTLVFCKFQFNSDEAVGVGGKYGMRKEGQELEGMKELRKGQSNEEGG